MNFRTFLYAFFASVLLAAGAARAQTWTAGGSPATVWNDSANWSGTYPNGASAAATFGASATTLIGLTGNVTVGSVTFTSLAPSYTLDTNGNNFSIYGSGIANSSGTSQTLNNTGFGLVDFYNSSSAGNAAVSNTSNMSFHDNSTASNASLINGGLLTFVDSSTGGSASILNNGTLGFYGTNAGNASITNNLVMSFEGSASAGNASILNNANSIGVKGTSTLSSASVQNDALLYFQDSGSAGTAAITNTYAISFYDQSTAGSATITNDGGNISFSQNSDGGQARFIFLNGGGLSVDDSTHVGAVTVGSIEGSGTVYMGLNGVVEGSNNLSTTFTGVIDDGIYNGTFTKIGTGTLTLSGLNTYDGGTVINQGKLVVDTGGRLGTGVVQNHSVLDYVDSASAGAMTLITTSGATLHLKDSSDGGTARFIVYNGGSIDIASHTGAVTVGSVEGDGDLVLGANSLVTGGNDLDADLGGTISGTGALTKTGAGVLELSGSNSYSGGTTVQGGTLVIQNDDNLGDTSGLLRLEGCTLRTDNGILSNRNISVNTNAPVTLNTNGFDSSFGGAISGGGSGSLVKAGTGALTLTGNNTFTSTLVVNGGTLAAGNANALGAGTVSVTGGILSSAGSPLTFQIAGNYSQTLGGALNEGVGGPGQSDFWNVAQTANLDGTLRFYYYGAYTPQVGDMIGLIHAGNGVAGKFDQVIAPSLGRWYPLYDTYDVSLLAIQPSFQALGVSSNQAAVGAWLDANYLDPQLEPFILSQGTQSGGTLRATFDLIAPEELSSLYQIAYATARDHAAVAEARLAEVRGQDQGLASQFASWDEDGPRFAADLPAGQLRSMAEGSRQDERWGFFVAADKDLASLSADANAGAYQFTVTGANGGADYRLSRQLEAGLLFGYDQTTVTDPAGSKMQVSGGHAGLYGGWHPGGFFVGLLAEGGLNSYQTSRPAYGGEAKGSTQGTQFSGWMDMGYDWKAGGLTVSPYAAGRFTSAQFDAFTETGSNMPLDIRSKAETAVEAEAGARFSWDWKAGSVVIRPRIGGAWEHYFDGTLSTVSAGWVLPQDLTVAGQALGQDAVAALAEVGVIVERDITLSARYKGRFVQDLSDSQVITGSLAVAF